MTCQPELYLKKLCINVHSCEFKKNKTNKGERQKKKEKDKKKLMFSV